MIEIESGPCLGPSANQSRDPQVNNVNDSNYDVGIEKENFNYSKNRSVQSVLVFAQSPSRMLKNRNQRHTENFQSIDKNTG